MTPFDHIVFFLVALVYYIPTNHTQSTNTKQCECERTPDGRCVYSLMAPYTCNTPNDECTNQNNNLSDSIIQTLMANLSETKQTCHQNTRLLSQLQSLMLELQVTGSQPTNTYLNASLIILQSAITALTTTVNNLQERSRLSEQQINQIQQQQTEMLPNKNVCGTKGLLISGRDPDRTDTVGGIGRYIQDNQITVSSYFNDDHGALKSRIYTTESPAAWCSCKYWKGMGGEVQFV